MAPTNKKSRTLRAAKRTAAASRRGDDELKLKFEPRDPSHNRKWRVENSATGEAYDIVPGHDDGEAANSPDAPYPRGDVWILRYRGTELDDGVNCTTGGPGCTTEADLDKFVNGESVNNKDVVVWYAGHVTHDVAHEPPGSFGHVVGPDIKRVKW